MTNPEYITNHKQPPHHRGNTYGSGYDRPWQAPATDAKSLERADALLELRGALIGAQAIAKTLNELGRARDYEGTLLCLLDDIRKERRTITEGCK